MELYQLQTFVIVAEEKSITGAAKRLYATPSTVSMHVKALEDELGVMLFTRTTRGMLITTKGEFLRDKAIQTLHSAQDLVNHAMTMKHMLIGTLSLGINTTASLLRIPALIQKLHENYPGIDLNLLQMSSQKIVPAIISESIDTGFVFGEIDNPKLVVVDLATIELVVAMPGSWDNSEQMLDWEGLSHLAWVSAGMDCPFHLILEQHLDSMSLSCHNIVKMDNDNSRFDLVASGVGLSLLEHEYARVGVQNGSLKIAPVDPLP